MGRRATSRWQPCPPSARPCVGSKSAVLIGIDFPTVTAKADRKLIDDKLGETLKGWPHERTAMNGFGFVQLVARLDGPSLLHRLTYSRTSAAARFLLRKAEQLEGTGGRIELMAHPEVLGATPT